MCLLFRYFAIAVFCYITVPLFSQTQNWNREVSLSLVNVSTFLELERSSLFYSPSGSVSGQGRGGQKASSLGLQFNYIQPLSTRWAAGLNSVFTTRSAEESIGGRRDYPVTENRTYQLFALESYLYLRLGRPTNKLSGLVGLGVSYQFYYQEYLGSYVFNLATEQFDERNTTEEHINTFGIPIEARVNYSLSEKFSAGINGGYNALFINGHFLRLGLHLGYHF